MDQERLVSMQNGVVGIGDEIFVAPRAGQQADIGHANDGQAVPAFRAHGAAGSREADGRGRLAIGKIAGEESCLDDVGALRGHAFVVVAEGAQARAVFEPRVGYYVDDVGGVAQLAQLIEGEKTHAGEIRFHAQHAVELDGMADGFVNLQAQLRAFEDEWCARLRGTARLCAARRPLRPRAAALPTRSSDFDEFIAGELMLPAKAIGIGALLDFVAGETGGHDARAGLHLDLMNARAERRGVPLLDAGGTAWRFPPA